MGAPCFVQMRYVIYLFILQYFFGKFFIFSEFFQKKPLSKAGFATYRAITDVLIWIC